MRFRRLHTCNHPICLYCVNERQWIHCLCRCRSLLLWITLVVPDNRKFTIRCDLLIATCPSVPVDVTRYLLLTTYEKYGNDTLCPFHIYFFGHSSGTTRARNARTWSFLKTAWNVNNNLLLFLTIIIFRNNGLILKRPEKILYVEKCTKRTRHTRKAAGCWAEKIDFTHSYRLSKSGAIEENENKTEFVIWSIYFVNLVSVNITKITKNPNCAKNGQGKTALESLLSKVKSTLGSL